MLRALALLLLAGLSALNLQAQHPRDSEIHDPDTLAWWHTTEFLSSDAMEGRDTGSAAYSRAAEYVAQRMKAAGLTPAGESRSYLQSVPMHELAVEPRDSNFTVVGNTGLSIPLAFLQEVTVTPSVAYLYEGSGPLEFRGYCGKDAMQNIEGRVVVCLGTQRQGLPTSAERLANAREGGARGLISVDDPFFTIEPPRWPHAYARSVALNPAPRSGEIAVPRGSAAPYPTLVPMRISAEAFGKLLVGSDHNAASLLKLGGAKQPLPSFAIPATFSARLHVVERDLNSPNVLGVLPGSDPELKDEFVVVSAHLDGYGFGTPVAGDSLYNGALDDAAYVALLLQYADDVKAGKLPRPKRSILIAAFTGEEKGLLGSTWFVQHPTVAKEKIVADINLDQLRPLFPLRILTVPGIELTSLGKLARGVAAQQHIELREDREPERGLLRRADNWPFMRSGIPAIGFVFGFDSGTDAERRYREWYQVRYHRPQDDITQPIDFAAARDFNTFFYRLTEAAAKVNERPKLLAPPAK